jgi:hypothetical protein
MPMKKDGKNSGETMSDPLPRRFDRVSLLLTGEAFDAFVAHNANLLKSLQTKYQNTIPTASLKDFFIRELFHKRNRIVHFGKMMIGTRPMKPELGSGVVLEIMLTPTRYRFEKSSSEEDASSTLLRV